MIPRPTSSLSSKADLYLFYRFLVSFFEGEGSGEQ